MTRHRLVVALLLVSATLGTGLLVAAFPSAPPVVSHPSVEPTLRPAVAPLVRSQPVRVTVARVELDAEIVAVGTNPDGTPETPPLDSPELAGWYRSGPSPGEAGNAVVLGHVDTRDGPAVFSALGLLVPGDLIAVAREDRSVAQFVVDRVESYPKAEFPTDAVFGPTPAPTLRLVTCGGEFDDGSYADNVVVSASLIAPAVA